VERARMGKLSPLFSRKTRRRGDGTSPGRDHLFQSSCSERGSHKNSQLGLQGKQTEGKKNSSYHEHPEKGDFALGALGGKKRKERFRRKKKKEPKGGEVLIKITFSNAFLKVQHKKGQWSRP